MIKHSITLKTMGYLISACNRYTLFTIMRDVKKILCQVLQFNGNTVNYDKHLCIFFAR